MRDQSIFLTGATGTVGRDLLRTLATRNGLRLNVLVRRTDRGPCDRDTAILRDLDVTAKINVVEGDISCGSTRGVDADGLATLRRGTTHIIHAAGTTSFTLPLAAARAANVDGTRNVLHFAGTCASLESGAFLSTVYVSGKRRGIFAEWEYGDRGEGFVNSYEQSKAEMEAVVRDAMCELPLSLVRLSTVVGDSATGRVSGFNTIHHAIRLLYNGLAPMIPGDPAEPVDIVSSDFVSAAVLHLVENAEPGVFHLAAGRDSSSSLEDLIGETVSALTRFRPAWRKRAVERPLIVDLDTYELFVRSVEETGNEVLKGATRSIRTFAYQLAHPKVFVTNRAAAILDGSGIAPQRSSDFYPRVVQYCLESNWGTRPC
jgi:nucleoside-diphosphate-sugar epimerase